MSDSVSFVPRDRGKVPLWPSLIPVQDKAPAASTAAWVDTSGDAAELKLWDGTGWAPAGAAAGAAAAAAMVAGHSHVLVDAEGPYFDLNQDGTVVILVDAEGPYFL